MSIFGRISTAMVTPFDAKGYIDFQKTTYLVEYLIQHGSDSLVVAGTTGESPTLTKEEKIALFKHVVKVVNGRVPVIAGTGSNNTKESVELTKKAEEIGVDGILLVVPYYNKPNQEGIYQHFRAIAEATSLPVMLYNIPGRSGVNMLPETVIRLAEIPNVRAVKEAGGDLNQMSEIIANTPDDFALYSGDDSLTLPVLSIGGEGVVSVASHVVGDEMQKNDQGLFRRRLSDGPEMASYIASPDERAVHGPEPRSRENGPAADRPGRGKRPIAFSSADGGRKKQAHGFVERSRQNLMDFPSGRKRSTFVSSGSSPNVSGMLPFLWAGNLLRWPDGERPEFSGNALHAGYGRSQIRSQSSPIFRESTSFLEQKISSERRLERSPNFTEMLLKGLDHPKFVSGRSGISRMPILRAGKSLRSTDPGEAPRFSGGKRRPVRKT